jgi:ABC-type microcin C transport system duplicated ATPase subunit YejF
MAAIEAANLRRTYKTHTGTVRRRSKEIEAVRGISFSVEPGELFGLLGPLVGAVYGVAGYLLVRWFETLSRRHASLERS